MHFAHYLKKGFEMIRLHTPAVQEIAHDELAFGPGLLIVLIAGLCLSVGKYLLEPVPFFYVLLAPLAFLVFFTLTMFVVHLVALLFGGHGSLVALHRAASVGAMFGWLLLIPKVGWLLSVLWYIPMLVRIVQVTHNLAFGKSLRSILLASAIALNFYLVVLGLETCSSEWLHGTRYNPAIKPVPAETSPNPFP